MAHTLPARNTIDDKYKWDLGDIYASDSLWEEDFKKVRDMVPAITALKGTLAGGADKLLRLLTLSDELSMKLDNLFIYARMNRDENNAEARYQALTDRCGALGSEVEAALSFAVPEILTIPEDRLNAFVAGEPGLAVYRHHLDEILRMKEHILSEREEELLALSSESTHAAGDIFTMLNNADIKFGTISNEDGEEVELTKGRYSAFLESKNRRVREDAFRTLYKAYIAHKNTLAASLNGNIKKNIFYTKARRYPSSRERSLNADNVQLDVYDNLIATTHANLPLLQRYIALRKRVLGLDELHPYDMYVSIVDVPQKKYTYEEAQDMVRRGLAPLGGEYLANLDKGLSSRWVDVYETDGKTSGAYAWGSYTTHPFVLLNFQGMINDVFTLAHEMGHAMHSFYSNRTQAYVNHDTKIFLAEVASTVNETLLTKQLLKCCPDDTEKAYLLNHYLEEFRGTIFRQVMFAEFEKITHDLAEGGDALTADKFSEVYRGLNEKYFGSGLTIDSELDMEWARIPHFYSSFYVYKYATGFSAATSLAMQMLSEGQPAVDRYIGFLSSGNSDYPIEILKRAGVDLSKTEPIQKAFDAFNENLTELEGLLK